MSAEGAWLDMEKDVDFGAKNGIFEAKKGIFWLKTGQK